MTEENHRKTASCVLLADRHADFVDATRDLLKTAFELVYTVGDTRSLRDGAERLHPTVIVIDIPELRKESFELIWRIRQVSSSSKIIALIVHDQEIVQQKTLDAGADAVVLKSQAAFDLLKAVDAVCLGESFISSREKTHGELTVND